jgi:DNA-binding phage protein
MESLADPAAAREYLKAVLEDYPEGFPKALRNVVHAMHEKRPIDSAGRELFDRLYESGDSAFPTLTGVLASLGLRFSLDDLQNEQAAGVELEAQIASREEHLASHA